MEGVKIHFLRVLVGKKVMLVGEEQVAGVVVWLAGVLAVASPVKDLVSAQACHHLVQCHHRVQSHHHQVGQLSFFS